MRSAAGPPEQNSFTLTTPSGPATMSPAGTAAIARCLLGSQVPVCGTMPLAGPSRRWVTVSRLGGSTMIEEAMRMAVSASARTLAMTPEQQQQFDEQGFILIEDFF